MKAEIRLGLVGYGQNTTGNDLGGGRGAGLLRLATTAFEGVRAAGICDIDPRTLSVAREKFPGVPCFERFDDLLRDIPLDALLIETPALLHAEFAIKALERNIHVLSDIPCVQTLDEAWALWAAQEKSQAFYMTGANANFKGFIEAALDLKKRGLLGEPYYCEAAYYHGRAPVYRDRPPSAEWRRTLESIRYCTHSLGPVLRLVDEDLEWTSCFDTGSHMNRRPDEHDAMTAIFRTKSNVVVHLLVSFKHDSPLDYQHQYRFITTKGGFERTLAYPVFDPAQPGAGGPNRGKTLFYSNELYGYRQWIELPIDGYTRPEYEDKVKLGHSGLDYAMWDAFLKAVRAGGPSPVSLREGLRMTLPGVFAAESAKRGGELLRIAYPWTAPQPPALTTGRMEPRQRHANSPGPARDRHQGLKNSERK